MSIVFGPIAYASVHRVWGHNLLVATVSGVVCGAIGYACYLLARMRKYARRWLSELKLSNEVPAYSVLHLVQWILVCVLAACSHLPADVIYSGHPELASWPVPLLWPFSDQGYVWPLVVWGDLTTTLVFAGEMFALYRWPQRAQVIALITLLSVNGYVVFCWVTINS